MIPRLKTHKPDPSHRRKDAISRLATFAVLIFLAGCALFDTPVSTPTPQPENLVILDLTPGPAPTDEPAPTSDPLLELGVQAAAAGDVALAIQYFDALIEHDPNSAQGYYQRGLAHLQSGAFDLALANLNQAIALQVDFAEPYFHRGLIYRWMGDWSAARRDFSQAINLQPSFAPAYKYRGLVEAELGLDHVARIDLQVYLTLLPNAGDVGYLESIMASLDEPLLVSPNAPPGAAFFDDFATQDGGWLGGGSAEGFASYQYDGYVIIVTTPHSVIWARPTLWFQDVIIEANVEMFAGPHNNFYGLFCRYQDEYNFYAFLISSDGFYGIARRVDAGPLELIGMKLMPYSAHINQGEAENHIRAECLGSTLRLIANGVLLAEVQEDSIPSGDVGILAGTYDEARPNFLFDDFVVFQIE